MPKNDIPDRGPLLVTARSDHVDWLAREACKLGLTISRFLERLLVDAIRRHASQQQEEARRAIRADLALARILEVEQREAGGP